MSVSTEELAQLKRTLLTQYEAEIAQLSSSSPSHSAFNEENSAPHSSSDATAGLPLDLPSSAQLNLQLLCLRAGHSIHDVPATAREQVVLMAGAMPFSSVVVQQRLRHAQEESVRLLVKRTRQLLHETSNEEAATTLSGPHAQQEERQKAVEGGNASVVAADRMRILEQMLSTDAKSPSTDDASAE